MIYSSEIRQGNYLLDRFGEVEQISQFDTYNWLENDYSGIPLTENWLVRFGMELPINEDIHYNDGEAEYNCWYNEFKKIHQDCLSATYNYKGLVFWQESTGFWCNILNNYTHIEYVHQFQNLIFALDKTELEIIKQK